MSLYETIASIEPDNLIAGHDVNLLTESVTLLAGQGILKRGAVLGVITVSGKSKLCDKNSIDGSQIAKYILMDNIDTTSSDKMARVYITGMFNKKALTFSVNGAPDSLEADLRDVGIYLRDEYLLFGPR